MSFLGIHLFPTIMVYLGCLPLYALTRPGAAGLSWLDGVGMVVLLGAIVLAFVADEQLRAFRSDPRTGAAVIGSGLWARSRHPNYLGEMATWWGLWLFALAAGLEWWWTVVGAVAITVMFVFVSVPMMEKRRLATRAGYAEYREQTPMLVPRLLRRRSSCRRSGDPLSVEPAASAGPAPAEPGLLLLPVLAHLERGGLSEPLDVADELHQRGDETAQAEDEERRQPARGCRRRPAR